MTEAEIVHLAIGGTATLIFILQNLGSLTGGDAGDLETDFDGESDFEGGEGETHSLSGYLSIRNLVAFFMGYGWVAFAGLRAGFAEIPSALMGVGTGLVLVFVSIAMLRLFSRFQEDGTLKTEGLVGRTGTVYIAVGASGGKAGKVFVDTSAGRSELQARTSSKRELKAGEVVVIAKTENGVLWVLPQEAEPQEK